MKGDISMIKKNGKGKLLRTNGNQYEGEWKDNKYHGQGILIIKASGERYDGKWENNMRNGKGTNYFADGTSKEGIWKNDKCL